MAVDWEYRQLRKPVTVIAAGRDVKVKAGDLISYREQYTDGTAGRRLGIVVAEVWHCTDIARTMKFSALAVLAANDTLTFGYERHVPPEDILEVSEPWDAFKDFMLIEMRNHRADPAAVFAAAESGMLNKEHVGKFLEGQRRKSKVPQEKETLAHGR